MKRHLVEMARYNAWANGRLYADTASLPGDAAYRDVGIYFDSLFGTLAHILKVDRVWMHLLDGGTLDDLPTVPLPDDLASLTIAREAEDRRLIDRLAAADDRWFGGPIVFQSRLPSWRDKTYRGTRATILTHLFNHQTHHRGQAHTALSLLGMEPQALDILVKGFLDQGPSELGEMPA